MHRIVVTALLAASLAGISAPAASDYVPPIVQAYENVTLKLPRGPFDPKAMALGYCNGKGWRYVSKYTVGMIDPGTAFFSKIVCIWHK